MAFKEKVQENITVDAAWNKLFQRLDNDGLLPKEHKLIPEGDESFPKEYILHQEDNISLADIEIERRKLRQLTFRRMLYIAAIFAACIISGWYFTRETSIPAKEMMVLHNEANDPTLAAMLEDGSVVYLSGQTSLKYPDRFADDKREVFLLGNAFFEIKKQPERPFFIDTEIAKIEVTGTSFSVVSNDKSSFLLSVREGEVRVTNKSSNKIITAKAGESVLLDSENFQLIGNTTQFDKYFKYIHFKDEHLRDVASIINMHYGSLRLEIDREVETRLITFTLSTNHDIADIAEVMCMALQLQHSQQGNTIYITK